jgi:hypothetical protein
MDTKASDMEKADTTHIEHIQLQEEDVSPTFERKTMQVFRSLREA